MGITSLRAVSLPKSHVICTRIPEVYLINLTSRGFTDYVQLVSGASCRHFYGSYGASWAYVKAKGLEYTCVGVSQIYSDVCCETSTWHVSTHTTAGPSNDSHSWSVNYSRWSKNQRRDTLSSNPHTEWYSKESWHDVRSRKARKEEENERTRMRSILWRRIRRS